MRLQRGKFLEVLNLDQEYRRLQFGYIVITGFVTEKKKCGKNVLIYRSREWPCVSVLSNAAIFTNIKVKIWILLVMREVKQLSPTYLHTHSTGNEPLLLTCETSSTSELHPLSSHSVSQAGFKP